jgi:DNA end-binding protein Ku
MPRPLWTGAISFGLINIPVQLMPGEKRVDLRFHLIDSRDKARVRYERINAETGDEVPWKDVVKAYEYEKGSYVVLEQEDFKRAAPDSTESVDIEAFIDAGDIGPEYYDRPYYLVPSKKSEKGYVLLRESLREANKVALARVVIRTREHLALVRPAEAALMLMLLRYPQELVPADDYTFPEGTLRRYRISDKELEMARQLVNSMSARWNPKDYRDEFREKLSKAIRMRLRQKGGKFKTGRTHATEEPRSDKVVDFMALLRKSIDGKQRTPAAAGTSPPKAEPGHRSSRTRRNA